MHLVSVNIVLTFDERDQVTEQVIQQLAQLKNTITDGANAIRGSAAAMYALKPVCDEEA